MKTCGKVVAEGDGAGEAGEVGEGGVGGEGEDGEDGADADVVEPAVAHDGVDELGEDGLVACAGGVGCADVVGTGEKSDAAEEDHQQDDDDGEGALGVALGGLAEGVDAVGDGFYAGHGGAAAGEDLEQEPEREHGDGCG